MMILVHIALLAACILLLARLLPGVRIRSASTALVVAVTFSILNFFLGWLIGLAVRAVLFVPAVMTLGVLFLLVPFIVNAVLLWITDKLLASFEIQSLRGLAGAAAAITIVNGVLYAPLFRAAATHHSHWGYAAHLI